MCGSEVPVCEAPQTVNEYSVRDRESAVVEQRKQQVRCRAAALQAVNAERGGVPWLAPDRVPHLDRINTGTRCCHGGLTHAVGPCSPRASAFSLQATHTAPMAFGAFRFFALTTQRRPACIEVVSGGGVWTLSSAHRKVGSVDQRPHTCHWHSNTAGAVVPAAAWFGALIRRVHIEHGTVLGGLPPAT